jgi:hypothetical protein
MKNATDTFVYYIWTTIITVLFIRFSTKRSAFAESTAVLATENSFLLIAFGRFFFGVFL